VTGLYFNRVSGLLRYERRLIDLLNSQTRALTRPYESLFRYAFGLAKLGSIRLEGGRDLRLDEEVQPFRRWFTERLSVAFAEGRAPRVEELVRLVPLLTLRVDALRLGLLVRFAGVLSESRLEQELSVKKVALALGGGGGSGFPHLGVFDMLEDLGVRPSLIVGTSLGAMMGFMRASVERFDTTSALLDLPQWFDLGGAVRPFSGGSRFGFPGVFDLDLREIGRRLCQRDWGNEIPCFSDLPIPLGCVATGVLRGAGLDEAALDLAMKRSRGRFAFTPLRTRRLLKVVIEQMRRLTSNPRFLTEVVFGLSRQSRPMRVVDGIGFSCSVPGVLHYEVEEEHADTIAALEALFAEEGIFRLTDGGLVNNVPSRVAWDAVQSGMLGTRNVLIYGVDVFAPVANRNALFLPMQQIARANVIANRPYADLTRTLRKVPSPMNLAPSLKQLQRVVQETRVHLAEDRLYLRRALQPQRPYMAWRSEVHLPTSVFSEGDEGRWR